MGHAGRTITQPVKPMLSVDSLPRNRRIMKDHSAATSVSGGEGSDGDLSKKTSTSTFTHSHSGEKSDNGGNMGQ